MIRGFCDAVKRRKHSPGGRKAAGGEDAGGRKPPTFPERVFIRLFTSLLPRKVGLVPPSPGSTGNGAAYGMDGAGCAGIRLRVFRGTWSDGRGGGVGRCGIVPGKARWGGGRGRDPLALERFTFEKGENARRQHGKRYRVRHGRRGLYRNPAAFFRGTWSDGRCGGVGRCEFVPGKARWGGERGFGGRGRPSRASRGSPPSPDTSTSGPFPCPQERGQRAQS